MLGSQGWCAICDNYLKAS